MKLKTIFGIAGHVTNGALWVAKNLPNMGLAGATFAAIAAGHMVDPDVSQAAQPPTTDAINSIVQVDEERSQPFEPDLAMINGNFIKLGDEAPPFEGHADYCKEHPDRCFDDEEKSDEYGMVIEPTVGEMQDKIDKIQAINTYVNEHVKQILDEEEYKKSEYWAIAGDAGDCEDLVLLKRQMLHDAGFPYDRMFILGVDPHIPNDPTLHAVLVVRTGMGDMILDNRSSGDGTGNISDIKFLPETGYTPIKATSPTDFSKWQVASIAPKIDEKTFLANFDLLNEEHPEKAPVPLPRNARPGGYEF